MRRVNWTITEHQHRELKRLSKETGLSISDLVRRALDKYIGLFGEKAQLGDLTTPKVIIDEESEVSA
ncbi:ribbon-helix-helix domain-containing protein [Candidatus Acetothermia bacterium]|nr:ribbon-helix-helix domain-containing protein [Candidatus Acetothermia bacterium]MBI3642907.1 ribbon-helix-helix domain-containing protein [Candidatus Acetothermia bacterium]